MGDHPIPRHRRGLRASVFGRSLPPLRFQPGTPSDVIALLSLERGELMRARDPYSRFTGRARPKRRPKPGEAGFRVASQRS